jgi:hypothetical protein
MQIFSKSNTIAITKSANQKPNYSAEKKYSAKTRNMWQAPKRKTKQFKFLMSNHIQLYDVMLWK